MNYWIFTYPIIGAVIGWLIAAIAVRFLFFPVRKKRIAGFLFQGLIPSKKDAVFNKIAHFASSLLSTEKIASQIKDPRNLDNVMPVIEIHMDDFLRHRLKKEMPMIAMFIGDKTIDSLKTTFMKEIEQLLPQVIDKYVTNLTTGLDVRKMISDKLNEYPSDQIYKSVQKAILPQIKAIKIGGLLIGLIIGIVLAGTTLLLIRS